MSLADDYQRQLQWRSWPAVFARLPSVQGQWVLDLGCAVGDQSAEFVARGARVSGMDGNDELLQVARSKGLANAQFIQADLRALPELGTTADGLWCSFAAAYFPELPAVLASWARHVKPGAWICLVEIDDLFGHEPLSTTAKRLLDAYAREHSAMPRRRMGHLRRGLRPRWIAVGATAATAAIAIAVGIVVLGGGEPQRTYDVEFRTVGLEGASAKANLESSDSGTTVHLWVKGLPKDDHAVYEVMCDAPMWTASAGTFRTSPDGRAYVVLTTALRHGEYDGIRVVKRAHGADGKLVRRNILTARIS
jgi:SAM-dependent methyltransferase